MRFNYIKGDLFTAPLDIPLAHGCNTKGVMGAGIAAQFARRYDGLFVRYNYECLNGDFVLGSCSRFVARDGRTIFNLGTQINPGRDASEHGIRLAFANLFEQLHAAELQDVAIPEIGCGIGGLRWVHAGGAIREASYSFEKFYGVQAPTVHVYILP